MQKKMIFLVAGARPNFMKIAPIVHQLQSRSSQFDFRLVHTGQHSSRDMSTIFFEELAIPEPDYHLDVGGGSHATQTATIMTRFEAICIENPPDLVLVVGDVNSTLACSIVAKKLHIKLAHVEAGLRSGDRKMPEEINRLVTDAISDLFFVTERSGLEHLREEGHNDDHIHFVGHVMIDNLFHQIARVERGDYEDILANSPVPALEKYAVVTLHRPSNVDDPEKLKLLVSMLKSAAEHVPLVFPIHPRTQKNLQKFGLELDKNIIQLAPLSYVQFMDCFRKAAFVITDSGGLQEETTALGIPCITVRDSTERPITIEAGSNTLVPLQEASDISHILDEIVRIMEGKGKHGRVPKFWDGKAAERILDVLAQQL